MGLDTSLNISRRHMRCTGTQAACKAQQVQPHSHLLHSPLNVSQRILQLSCQLCISGYAGCQLRSCPCLLYLTGKTRCHAEFDRVPAYVWSRATTSSQPGALHSDSAQASDAHALIQEQHFLGVQVHCRVMHMQKRLFFSQFDCSV